MEGSGAQERSAVRCLGPGIVKTEVCAESAIKGQGQVVRSSCPTLMEARASSNQTNGIENKDSGNSALNYSSNGLDSKTSKIKQIVEDAISPDSKHAVMRILDQVNELSTAEKLLLYLKLPTGKSGNLDPLRQPLNPLGSRFEIHQTITWIKTHLEEDEDVSLPKQDVYEEYIAYCNSNAMKPLSTADFGKVMKQVFPRVRPRRLGTRGNSRYCYAGMRKKMKLEAPLLPDLGEETKSSSESCSEDEVVSAASCLVREWAEKLLGIRFESLRDLACHLVENLCVDSRSVAAFTVLSGNKTTPNLCAGKVGGQNKHRQTQLQLQRKLQEREVIREQKRKLQEQAAAVSKCSSRGKKAKLSTNVTSQGEQANCDKSTGRSKRVPDTQPASTNTFSPVPDAKMPIPRLANQSKPSKQLANVIILPQILQQKSPKKKYKPIQPKPEDKKEKEVSIGCLEKDALDDYNSQEQEEELMRYFQHQNSSSSNEEPEDKSDKLSQLRLLLERNLEPSSEAFLPNQAVTTQPSTSTNSVSQLSQRTQNRSTGKPALLLPSLLSNGSSHTSLGSRRRVSFETSVMEHYQEATVPPSPNTRRRIFSFTPISPGPHSPLGAQRISSKPSSANASPFVSPRNTPVPRSRHNSGQASYQNRIRHSAVAAKVVRSNSVNSHYQPPRLRAPDTFAVPTGPPPMSPLSISAPQSPMISFQSTETSALMTAATNQFPDASQNLLQAVLQPKTFPPAEQKPSMPVPADPLSQEVSRFFSDSEQNLASLPLQYRSQSVPLHRMTSALVSPQLQFHTNTFNLGHFSASNSVAPTPVPSEFTDFISTGGDSSTTPSANLLMVNGEDAELNSENLNRIFNLLDDVQEEQQKEQQLSLTLDIDIAQQNSHKFLQQPSRSYPNTPLPYIRDPVVSSFTASLPTDTSRSYPSTPLMSLPGFGVSEDDGPFQQELGEGQITLNALNVRTTRRNINSLLDQPPFSVDDELALDTLEALEGCDTLTQLVQEVNSSDHITD